MEPALRKGDSKDGKGQIASACRDSARQTWVKGSPDLQERTAEEETFKFWELIRFLF